MHLKNACHLHKESLAPCSSSWCIFKRILYLEWTLKSQCSYHLVVLGGIRPERGQTRITFIIHSVIRISEMMFKCSEHL